MKKLDILQFAFGFLGVIICSLMCYTYFSQYTMDGGGDEFSVAVNRGYMAITICANVFITLCVCRSNPREKSATWCYIMLLSLLPSIIGILFGFEYGNIYGCVLYHICYVISIMPFYFGYLLYRDWRAKQRLLRVLDKFVMLPDIRVSMCIEDKLSDKNSTISLYFNKFTDKYNILTYYNILTGEEKKFYLDVDLHYLNSYYKSFFSVVDKSGFLVDNMQNFKHLADKETFAIEVGENSMIFYFGQGGSFAYFEKYTTDIIEFANDILRRLNYRLRKRFAICHFTDDSVLIKTTSLMLRETDFGLKLDAAKMEGAEFYIKKIKGVCDMFENKVYGFIDTFNLNPIEEDYLYELNRRKFKMDNTYLMNTIDSVPFMSPYMQYEVLKSIYDKMIATNPTFA